MGFLDPPAPEQLPRGVVTWPLFCAAALAVVVRVLGGDVSSLGFVLWVAIVAQVMSLSTALFTIRRLFATGATRARVVRILVVGVLAAAAALATAVPATEVIRLIEIVCAGIALAIVVRAAIGWKHAV